MPEAKVLIADDDADVLGVMAKRVGKEGYQVIEAKNGREAWEKTRTEAPDVILLDLVMPDMDGYEVLQKIRSQPSSSKWQPVVIVSAKGELEDMQKGFSLEADHYMTKPCNMEDIIKTIRLMLSLIPQRKTQEELKQEGT